MAIAKKVLSHLEKADAKYEIVEHKKVYTAYDAALTMRRKIEEIVKNLIIKTDNAYILVLVPANKNLDLKKLKVLVNKNSEKPVKKVEIPKENIMTKVFKVKHGAMPAFGSLYKIPVYLDKSLQKQKKAIFPAGSYTESLELTIKDFEKLERPIIGIFSATKKLPKFQKPKVKSKKKQVDKKLKGKLKKKLIAKKRRR